MAIRASVDYVFAASNLAQSAPMNRFERRPITPGEAQVEFLDGDFRILRPGTFVRCAVTGEPIPIDDLRYWDVDRQEAYASPQAKLTRLAIDVKL
jgi:hypothetical protein